MQGYRVEQVNQICYVSVQVEVQWKQYTQLHGEQQMMAEWQQAKKQHRQASRLQSHAINDFTNWAPFSQPL